MKGKYYFELLAMNEAQRFLQYHEFGTEYNIPAQNVSIGSIFIFTWGLFVELTFFHDILGQKYYKECA